MLDANFSWGNAGGGEVVAQGVGHVRSHCSHTDVYYIPLILKAHEIEHMVQAIVGICLVLADFWKWTHCSAYPTTTVANLIAKGAQHSAKETVVFHAAAATTLVHKPGVEMRKLENDFSVGRVVEKEVFEGNVCGVVAA